MRAIDRAGGHATCVPLHARPPVGAGGLVPRRTGKRGREGGAGPPPPSRVVAGRARGRRPIGKGFVLKSRASGRCGSVLLDHVSRDPPSRAGGPLAGAVARNKSGSTRATMSCMRCLEQSRVRATVVADSPPPVGAAVPSRGSSPGLHRLQAVGPVVGPPPLAPTAVDPTVDGPAVSRSLGYWRGVLLTTQSRW